MLIPLTFKSQKMNLQYQQKISRVQLRLTLKSASRILLLEIRQIGLQLRMTEGEGALTFSLIGQKLWEKEMAGKYW